jgi:ABC-type multidrug transport system ATPase subunit
VTQADHLMPFLKVGETLQYAAALRMDPSGQYRLGAHGLYAAPGHWVGFCA